LPSSGSSLSAGAGAGIGIAILILVLAIIGGVVMLLRKRKWRLRDQAQKPNDDEKPQLDDTSVVPQNGRFELGETPFQDRHELEGSSTPHTLIKIPAELRAGPFSNRHELEGRKK
jgi:predicted lipid-binding transport protein (Tim44 family)